MKKGIWAVKRPIYPRLPLVSEPLCLVLSAVIEHVSEHFESFCKVGVAVCPDSLSRRSRAWNPQLVAVWNCDEVAHGIRRRRYGIKAEGENTAQGADAMPDRVGIPYTLKRDAMPTPSGLDKKRHRSSDGVFLVDPRGIEPLSENLSA